MRNVSLFHVHQLYINEPNPSATKFPVTQLELIIQSGYQSLIRKSIEFLKLLFGESSSTEIVSTLFNPDGDFEINDEPSIITIQPFV